MNCSLFKGNKELEVDNSLEAEGVVSFDVLVMKQIQEPHANLYQREPSEQEIIQLQAMFYMIEQDVIVEVLKLYPQELAVGVLLDQRKVQLFKNRISNNNTDRKSCKYTVNETQLAFLQHCLESPKEKVANLAFNILNIVNINNSIQLSEFTDGTAIIKAIYKEQGSNLNEYQIKYVISQSLSNINEKNIYNWLFKFTSEYSNEMALVRLKLVMETFSYTFLQTPSLYIDFCRILFILLYPVYSSSDTEGRVLSLCKSLSEKVYTVTEDLTDIQAIVMSIELLKEVGEVCISNLIRINGFINMADNTGVLIEIITLWLLSDSQAVNEEKVKHIIEQIGVFDKIVEEFIKALFSFGNYSDILLKLFLNSNINEVKIYHKVIISLLQTIDVTDSTIILILEHYFLLYYQALSNAPINAIKSYNKLISEIGTILQAHHRITHSIQQIYDNYFLYLFWWVFSPSDTSIEFDKMVEVISLLSCMVSIATSSIITKTQLDCFKCISGIRSLYANILPFEPVSQEYVGLKNLSATCYINSLIQQLFNNTKFCNTILSSDCPHDTLVFQLQKTFKALSLRHCIKYYNPENLVYSLKFEEQPINVRIQEDVYIFLCKFFDKIERELKANSCPVIATNIYEGKLESQIISRDQDFPFENKRDETFCALSLQIKYNLEEALDQFCKFEQLIGDNAYFCEKYNRKVHAHKKTIIKELPSTLIIHLERFKYDSFFQSYKKVNDKMEFKLKMNFQKWCVDQDKEPSYYQYNLTGIILHNGSFEGGHYSSYINIRNSTLDGIWYNFDDTNALICNQQEVLSKSYGEEHSNFEGIGCGAYLLFYQRESTLLNESIDNSTQFHHQRIIGKYYNRNNLELIYNSILELCKTEKGVSVGSSKLSEMCSIFITIMKDVILYGNAKEEIAKLLRQYGLKLVSIRCGMEQFIDQLICDKDVMEILIYNANKPVRTEISSLILEIISTTIKVDGVQEPYFNKVTDSLLKCVPLLMQNYKEKDEFISLFLSCQEVLIKLKMTVFCSPSILTHLFNLINAKLGNSKEFAFAKELKIILNIITNKEQSQGPLIVSPELESFIKMVYPKMIYNFSHIPIVTSFMAMMLKQLSTNNLEFTSCILHTLAEYLAVIEKETAINEITGIIISLINIKDNLSIERIKCLFVYHIYKECYSLEKTFNNFILQKLYIALLNIVLKTYDENTEYYNSIINDNSEVITLSVLWLGPRY